MNKLILSVLCLMVSAQGFADDTNKPLNTKQVGTLRDLISEIDVKAQRPSMEQLHIKKATEQRLNEDATEVDRQLRQASPSKTEAETMSLEHTKKAMVRQMLINNSRSTGPAAPPVETTTDVTRSTTGQQ